MHRLKQLILPLFGVFNISCTHRAISIGLQPVVYRDKQPFVAYYNVHYSTIDTAEQKADIFTPVNSDDITTGVVIFIHGGGWVTGEKGDFNGLGLDTLLTCNNMAMVNINYRLAGQYPYPSALNDIDSVIEMIKSRAGQWHINPDKICLFGRSSGAHLALQYAYTRNTDNHIKVVVDLFGPADLTTADVLDNSLGINAATMLGPYDSNHALWHDASPIYHLDHAIPTLIMHGTIDSVVYTSQSIRLQDSLVARGVPCTYIPWAGNGHGWNQQRWNEYKDIALTFMKHYLQ